MINRPVLATRLLVVGVMVAFFATGFAALLYQVIWQRMLVLFTGSDVQSASLVISAYLAGLGLGTCLGLRLADRCSARRALQIYGVADVLVATFAVLSPWLFNDVLYQRSLGQTHGLLRLWVEVFLALVCPTVLMGLSLPMVCRALASRLDKVPGLVSWLNGINILGAAIGCIVGAWVLAPSKGFVGALQIGAMISVAAGALALCLSCFMGDQLPAKHSPVTTARMGSVVRSRTSRWALVFFLSGFLAIALQVAWFRIAIATSYNSPLVFAIILACFLLFDGLGSLAGIRWKWGSPWRSFLVLQVLIVGWAVFAVWWLAPRYLALSWIWPAIYPLVMIAPAAFLIGATFPVVQRAVHDDLGRVGERVGILQAANLAGNVLAGLLTGLVLLELWGSTAVFRLALLLGGIAAALLAHDLCKEAARWRFGSVVLALVAGGVLAWFFPAQKDFWYGLHPEKNNVIAFHAHEKGSGYASIAVMEDSSGLVMVNGHRQGSIPIAQSGIHLYLGALPVLLHPDPRDVLIIGLGSGGTAYGAGARETLGSIKVIELVAAEYPLHQEYLASRPDPALKALFVDERYSWLTGDARRWLASHEQKFDIIEADAMVPNSSGAGFLYSREFFQLVLSRLKPGGMMAQWSPTDLSDATFMHVFPYGVKLRGNLMIGSNQPIDLDKARLQTALATPYVVAHLERAGPGSQFLQANDMPVIPAYQWKPEDKPVDADINTDWWPRDEYR